MRAGPATRSQKGSRSRSGGCATDGNNQESNRRRCAAAPHRAPPRRPLLPRCGIPGQYSVPHLRFSRIVPDVNTDGPRRTTSVTGVSGAIALTAEESGPVDAMLATAAAMLRNDAGDGGATSLTQRDLEEQRLIDRCLSGEVEAFRPLVNRYQRVTFSVALRMLGSRADAEDVTQQAFVDAFNALDGFHADGRTHAFSTWLLRIAVNRSKKDVLKSKKRTEEPLDDEVPGAEAAFAYDPSNPEANASSGEQRHHLETALLRVSAEVPRGAHPPGPSRSSPLRRSTTSCSSPSRR